MSTEEDKTVYSRAEEFLQVFKKGAEFTQELLKENERLRYQVIELQERPRGGLESPPATNENSRLR